MHHWLSYRRTRRFGWMPLPLTAAVLLAGSGAGCSSSDTPAGAPLTVRPAANAAEFLSPFDATPDPSGEQIYFTAMSADGPGIFKVAAGGGASTRLFVGPPLVSPFGIAIAPDGKTLAVADGAAEGDDGATGALFVLPAAGGTPSPVAGTTGLTPRGVEVLGTDVYFTGSTPQGVAAVLKVPLGGGNATPLMQGAPLQDPSGIAVARDETLFVVDTVGAATRRAVVLKISGSAVAEVVSDLPVGFPAGIALTRDEATVLVSGLDRVKGTDAVYRIELGTKQEHTITQGFETFVEAAGLHRAKNAEVYAWADSTANTTGTVYVISK